ncbi:hypothetical protein [uncultured Cloacibacillus sp.]|uniref:hypothetical protein n=1 Tax=uncultured Cloacibacillus sp. TaxID=889794 RepID=UPI0026202C72|nr:hypothetical protein [uncultured Cloacibacillus sp.]
MRLSKVQQETIDFCKAQIDEARKQFIDLKKVKKSELRQTMEIIDAQNGIVYTQGGNCNIKTLKKLEKLGLLEILEDNSGIGTGFGAFPSKVKILNY